jgi:hypothetical protein
MSRKVPPEPSANEKHAVPHRSLRRRLSLQAIEELVARYTAGEKTPALIRELGISESGLRNLLWAKGVTLYGHAITPEDAEQPIQPYENRLTITQVVSQIGYSHATIRKVLPKLGDAIKSGLHGKTAKLDERS